MDSAIDPIYERARFLAKRPCSVRSIMILILYDLDAPLKYSGFAYLINVVQEAVNSGDIHIVASELYEIVRDKHEPNVEIETIEVGIRALIREVWKSRKEVVWQQYFPTRITKHRKQPGNVDFITALVYFVFLWQDLSGKEALCHASK